MKISVYGIICAYVSAYYICLRQTSPEWEPPINVPRISDIFSGLWYNKEIRKKEAFLLAGCFFLVQHQA
jgi:hypothetical protein